MIVEAEEPPSAAGMIGGVPGGVAGGALSGIIGGIGAAPPPPPPPPKPKPAAPTVARIGGNVQASKLIKQPKPVYPPLAKAARVQGTVKFQATIGKDGTIQNLQLLSGPPLLVPSAMAAVQQWTYQPTLLNGEAVDVITTIDVNFTLN
jgi:protein TonB